eukprot:m.37688 g.37688  ORF g.37688 m.37688 type:complete len:414 (+) comp7727_c0_seq1:851-2092(+)
MPILTAKSIDGLGDKCRIGEVSDVANWLYLSVAASLSISNGREQAEAFRKGVQEHFEMNVPKEALELVDVSLPGGPRLLVYSYQSQMLQSFVHPKTVWIGSEEVDDTSRHDIAQAWARQWAESLMGGHQVLYGEDDSPQSGSWKAFSRWVGEVDHFPTNLEMNALAQHIQRQICLVSVVCQQGKPKTSTFTRSEKGSLEHVITPLKLAVYGSELGWSQSPVGEPLLLYNEYLPEQPERVRSPLAARSISPLLPVLPRPSDVVKFGWIHPEMGYSSENLKSMLYNKVNSESLVTNAALVGPETGLFGAVLLLTTVETYIVTCLRMGNLRKNEPSPGAYVGAIIMASVTTILFVISLGAGAVLGIAVWNNYEEHRQILFAKVAWALTILFASVLFIFQLYIAAMMPPLLNEVSET